MAGPVRGSDRRAVGFVLTRGIVLEAGAFDTSLSSFLLPSALSLVLGLGLVASAIGLTSSAAGPAYPGRTVF